MAIKYKHSNAYSMYFLTCTCYQWIQLFELTDSYDCVYRWFNYLTEGKIAKVIAYVIMPNHFHCILYFMGEEFDLNKIVSNAKRFMAYELISRLKITGRTGLLERLSVGLTEREINKKQKHRVFENSFDAKPIYSEPFLHQKLDYIHHNPVSGKWHLVNDYTQYVHSSAAFYDLNESAHFIPVHYLDI
jgi:REP element-mobilizing transposase RayT